MPILALPNEILLFVAQNLDAPSLSAFTRTNRRLSQLLSSELLNTAVKNKRYLATAVFLAVSYNQGERLQKLLEKATQITISSYGVVLYDAGVCRMWHKSIPRLIDRLVDEGTTDLLIIDKSTGRTALHWAAAYGDAAMVRKLLALGAGHCYVRDRSGKTPLHCAAASANVTVVRALLEHKAWADGELDIAAKGVYELCAIHYTVQTGDKTTTALLLKGGASVHVVNVFGQTPLHMAAQERDLEMAKLLLKAGAKINAQDVDGLTPLHCAVHNNDEEMARLFVDAGADIHLSTLSLGTPYVHAVVMWGESMARVLSESEWERMKGRSAASIVIEQEQASRERRMLEEMAGFGNWSAYLVPV